MNSDINLLYSKKQGKLGKLTRKVKLLRLIALGLLSVVAFTSVVVFILILVSPLPRLKEQEIELTAQLSTQEVKITKYILLAARLAEANTITSKRSNFDETLEIFEKDLPVNVALSGFNAEQNIVKLQLSSTSLESLQSYMTTLATLTEEKIAKQVSLSNMVTDEAVGYVVNVTVILM